LAIAQVPKKWITHAHTRSKIYRHPRNFTESCATMHGTLAILDCPAQSPCVTMIEPRYLAGMCQLVDFRLTLTNSGYRVGENVIRGCFSKILVGKKDESSSSLPSTLEQRAVDMARTRNGQCQHVSARYFLPKEFAISASDKTWEVEEPQFAPLAINPILACRSACATANYATTNPCRTVQYPSFTTQSHVYSSPYACPYSTAICDATHLYLLSRGILSIIRTVHSKYSHSTFNTLSVLSNACIHDSQFPPLFVIVFFD